MTFPWLYPKFILALVRATALWQGFSFLKDELCGDPQISSLTIYCLSAQTPGLWLYLLFQTTPMLSNIFVMKGLKNSYPCSMGKFWLTALSSDIMVVFNYYESLLILILPTLVTKDLQTNTLSRTYNKNNCTVDYSV